MTSLLKLLTISSQPLAVGINSMLSEPSRFISQELLELLAKKNGFVAFENALLVLPCYDTKELEGIISWNSPTGWRRHYQEVVPAEILFFAEDAFAGQFGVSSEGVFRLEPETGELTIHSTDLEDWATNILRNYDFETGWSVAKAWQERYGSLPLGFRLLGKQPFVLGGDYVPENLRAIQGWQAMEKLGGLYHQIRNLSDGAQVTVQGWI